MKVTFEFNTEDESFSYQELEQYYQCEKMLYALDAICKQVREWWKYDDRSSIPVDEIQEKIISCINDSGVDMERMGY